MFVWNSSWTSHSNLPVAQKRVTLSVFRVSFVARIMLLYWPPSLCTRCMGMGMVKDPGGL